MVLGPTHLPFNEELSLKDDYEYTVQHIKEYGGAARCFLIMAHWKHERNKGEYSRTELLKRRRGILSC